MFDKKNFPDAVFLNGNYKIVRFIVMNFKVKRFVVYVCCLLLNQRHGLSLCMLAVEPASWAVIVYAWQLYFSMTMDVFSLIIKSKA